VGIGDDGSGGKRDGACGERRGQAVERHRYPRRSARGCANKRR
jgi:hypothetical protein